MGEENQSLRLIIEKGSEISGSVSGTALGLLIAGPLGALGGAVAGPLIAEIFRKVGTEISQRFLANREEIRVGATISMAVDKIENEITRGKVLRTDTFTKAKVGSRSDAETILEGTLLKVRSEYEEKKVQYYANFLANINLDSSISFEKGNTLLRIIEQISYRQMAILSHCQRVELIDTDKWAISFLRNEKLGECQDFYSEIMALYNQQLLQQLGTKGVGMIPAEMRLSPLGSLFYTLLDLENIELEDIDAIESTIAFINKEKTRD